MVALLLVSKRDTEGCVDRVRVHTYTIVIMFYTDGADGPLGALI